MLRYRPHPQLGTVTGDTTKAVLSKTGYMGGFHNGGKNSHSPYGHVLELYTHIISGMKCSSFGSFQHFELHHKQCPAGGTFLGY